MKSSPAVHHAHPNSAERTFAPHRVSSRCLAWLSQDEQGHLNAGAAPFNLLKLGQTSKHDEDSRNKHNPLYTDPSDRNATGHSSFTTTDPGGQLWLDQTIGDEPSGLTPPSTPIPPRIDTHPSYFWWPRKLECRLRGGERDGKASSIQTTAQSVYHRRSEHSASGSSHIHEKNEREVLSTTPDNSNRHDIYAATQYISDDDGLPACGPVGSERVQHQLEQQGSWVLIPPFLKKVTVCGVAVGHTRALDTPTPTASTSFLQLQSRSLKDGAGNAERWLSQKDDDSTESGLVNNDDAPVSTDDGAIGPVSVNSNKNGIVPPAVYDGTLKGPLHPFTARSDSRTRAPLNEAGQMVPWANTDGRFTHYVGTAIPCQQSGQVKPYPPVIISAHAYDTESCHYQQAHSPRKIHTELSHQVLNTKRLFTFRQPAFYENIDRGGSERVQLRGGGGEDDYDDPDLYDFFALKRLAKNHESWRVRGDYAWESKYPGLGAEDACRDTHMENWPLKDIPPSRFLPRHAIRTLWELPSVRVPGSRYESVICFDHRKQGSGTVDSDEIRASFDRSDYQPDSYPGRQILYGALKTVLKYHMSYPYESPVRLRLFHRDLVSEVLQDIDELIQSRNRKLDEIASELDPYLAESSEGVADKGFPGEEASWGMHGIPVQVDGRQGHDGFGVARTAKGFEKLRANQEEVDPKPRPSPDPPPAPSPEPPPVPPPPSPASPPLRPDTPQSDDLSPSGGFLDLRKKRLNRVRRDSAHSSLRGGWVCFGDDDIEEPWACDADRGFTECDKGSRAIPSGTVKRGNAQDDLEGGNQGKQPRPRAEMRMRRGGEGEDA